MSVGPPFRRSVGLSFYRSVHNAYATSPLSGFTALAQSHATGSGVYIKPYGIPTIETRPVASGPVGQWYNDASLSSGRTDGKTDEH